MIKKYAPLSSSHHPANYQPQFIIASDILRFNQNTSQTPEYYYPFYEQSKLMRTE